MASLQSKPGGRWQIQSPDKKRKTVRLGVMSEKDAKEAHERIEELIDVQTNGERPCRKTAYWRRHLKAEIYDRLAAVGLADPRRPPAAVTVSVFVSEYVDLRRKSGAKPNTIRNLDRVRKDLYEYFGDATPLAAVTPGDADKFRLWLLGEKGLGDNTVRRRCGRAKQFFRAAGRQKLITENPFADQKTSVRANKTRDYFVTRDEIESVIAECPDAEWRVIVALARYGGLRTPSEVLALEWSDINWDKSRMTVTAPKTEGEGKPYRLVPLFPELRPHLEDLFELAQARE
jgi:hypothetical protein